MPRSFATITLLAVALSTAGCNDSEADRRSQTTSRSVAPVAAAAEDCNGVHGNFPQQPTSSFSGAGGALVDALLPCSLRGGEPIAIEDADGTKRSACLKVPGGASAESPRPLVVFLHGATYPAAPQTLTSGLELLHATADLTGDPDRPGFVLLIPDGRDTTHIYPSPDEEGLGWDNWYRNFDRSDPAINRDVQAIDRLIAAVRERGIVDDRRIYMSGWSNGAAFSILYALNTPGIAATAVYASPDPFSDTQDPCAQPPFGDNLRPIMTIHNDCDSIGICTTGSEGFGAKVAELMPELEYRRVIVDVLQNEVDRCLDFCSGQDAVSSAVSTATVRHTFWPLAWNERIFAFLRERPLP